MGLIITKNKNLTLCHELCVTGKPVTTTACPRIYEYLTYAEFK